MGKFLDELLSKLKLHRETKPSYPYAYCYSYYDTKTGTYKYKEVSFRSVYAKSSALAAAAFGGVPLVITESVNLMQGDTLSQGLGLLLMCVGYPIALTGCAYVVVERKNLFPDKHPR